MIPLHLHQILIKEPQGFLAQNFPRWQQSFQQYNSGMVITVWNDASMRDNIKCNWIDIPGMLDNKVIPYVLKTDVLRFVILYEYGGIYSDLDVECLKSLKQFLNTSSFCGKSYPPNNFENHFFGSEAKNPMMQSVALSMWKGITDFYATGRPDSPETITAIGVNAAGAFLSACAEIHPIEYFSPVSWTNMSPTRRKGFDASRAFGNSYVIHYWTGMDEEGWTVDIWKESMGI
jgi:hypothetical protein